MGDFFFAELVKYALLDLKKRDNANRTLISSFIDDLLASPSAPTRPWLTGGFHHFPCRPFFQEIASMLALWGAYRRFPLIFPRFNLLEEVAGDVSQALDEQTPVVVRFFEKYGMLATDSVWSRIFCCRRPKRGKPQVLPPAPAMPVRSARDLPPGPQLSLLAVPWADPRTLLRPPRRRVGALIGELADLLDVRLGEGGIRRLLRMRRTVGAIPHALPPDPDALLACTRPLHDPRAKLTVAGRALTKHGVRCAWWGLPHACNDPAKNKLGEDLVASIIANAAWVNAHCIVHGQPQVCSSRLRTPTCCRHLPLLYIDRRNVPPSVLHCVAVRSARSCRLRVSLAVGQPCGGCGRGCGALQPPKPVTLHAPGGCDTSTGVFSVPSFASSVVVCRANRLAPIT